MLLEDCNPFLRAAQLQPAVLEGCGQRMAYDHRLFYVMKGTGNLILEGKEIPLEENAVLFIPPARDYYFRGKMTVMVLNFDLTRACSHRKEPICPPPAEAFQRERMFDSTLAHGLEDPFILAGTPLLEQEFTTLVRDFNQGGAGQDCRTSARLKLLLAEVFGQRTEGKAEDSLAYALRGYIRLHAPEITGNDELSRRFGYHPVYLGEVYRKAFGCGLHRAILEERITLACRWLAQTDRTVEEIALDTGFSGRSHFCTAFGRIMGKSPGEWRKEQW